MLKTQLIRPVNKDDLKYFDTYGASVRAIVAEVDGEPVVIAGILHCSPPQGFSVSINKPVMQENKKLMMKVIKRYREMLKKYKCDVWALQSETHDSSERVLKKAGFEKVENRFYKYSARCS